MPPALAFRPLRRPPLALLCVVDDGRSDGEWYRIRTETFVIGRAEGDVVIPHDVMMSARHADLTRQLVQGRYRWHLTDLGSTNGTFIRVSSALLRHGAELLAGNRRLRFETPAEALGDAPEAAEEGTAGWHRLGPADLVPSLVEITPQGEGQRFFLEDAELWLGRDPAQCAVALPHDPYLDPRHARVYRDAQGEWRIENADSVNGLWLRVRRIALETGGHFQLGEQRFILKVLS
jgi:pSer/pThr/pTyr-binding forkhead associated (FHA) protein